MLLLQKLKYSQCALNVGMRSGAPKMNLPFKITFYGLRRGLKILSLRCLLYEGMAAGFKPELVKLAALPHYQGAIPGDYISSSKTCVDFDERCT
jgi:hypothetical protein